MSLGSELFAEMSSLVVEAPHQPVDVRAGAAPSILKKAFDVLGSFSPDRRVLSFAEVARASGLPKSTTHRVLAMLVEMGAVEQHTDGYRIGLRMFAVGACSAEVALRDIALPAMEELHRIARQTLHLAVLRGPDVVYIEKLRTHQAVPTPAVVGASLPAHWTAVGKALLAEERAESAASTEVLRSRAGRKMADPAAFAQELTLSRARGYAVDREESVAGLACIAVPIVAGGSAVAALSVAFPAAAGKGEVLLNPLRATAARIGRSLPPALRGSLLRERHAR
ncbi:IclR family transcriptional regulator [Geodermatophilus ruber]|uniref:Transcriptional regulator, IclR family n=1 Tax=Geodermatophilus ruber TaxID=504800 RepID=A0A1I4BMQ5_9ACTN|nr:IclR family transcriptional regulator [Geodermatophilus ruber]SFK70114.1 transcriptional regulator, IclR family [Geodermatophilus ruber]